MTSVPQGLLIAGTATGVGKSVVARAIAASQPHRTWQTLSLALPLDLATTWQSIQTLQAGTQTETQTGLLIEAPGSLGTPVTFETTVADLAWDWRLPTVLVTAVSPHCLGDLAACAALAKQTRCPLRGIILNCTTPDAAEHLLDWANPRQIAALTQLSVLGKLPYLEDLGDVQQLATAGAALDWG